MTTTTLSLEYQPIHDCFGQWREEQESLDTDLAETFSSLEDYQSHLEDWQRELADQLDELQRERKRLERDKADSKQYEAEADSLSHELNEARQQMSQLSKELLSRTDELRVLDRKRAELATELELARARDHELTAALDDQKQWMDQQRNQWTEELKHLRELVEQRSLVSDGTRLAEPGNESISANDAQGVGSSADEAACADDSETEGQCEGNPVLGSIVAQFGKLRKQRSAGRQKVN
jgi:chromosome segregation ATPase